MSRYFEDLKAAQQDYTKKPFNKGDYEGCSFKNCNFSNTVISECNFIDCVFEDCNLSGVNITQTSFQETLFKNCKLVGVQFENARTFLFSPRFDNCVLTLSSFYGVTLRYTVFSACNLLEADFTDADCGGISFEFCDLLHAKFEHTNLEKANFKSAVNYAIDPEKNKIKKAAFTFPEAKGLLYKYDLIID